MFTKLFWLIVLHANVICTASFLDDHFEKSNDVFDKDVFFENPVDSWLRGGRITQDLATSLCAEECNQNPNICKSFVILESSSMGTWEFVTSVKGYPDSGGEFECLKFGTPSSKIVTHPAFGLRTLKVVRAVYNILEQRTFSLKDISRDMKNKSGEDWAKDILKRYGGSSVFSPDAIEEFYLPLLLLCRIIAMDATQPISFNFANNILFDGQETGHNENEERPRKKRKVNQEAGEKTSTQMINTDLASWTVPSRACSSPECFQAMALTFLQILGGNIRGGIPTRFNEENRDLIFEEGDLHLLVGFPRLGEYIIIWDPPNDADETVAQIYAANANGGHAPMAENINKYYEIFSGLPNGLGHTYLKDFDDYDSFKDDDVEVVITKVVLQVADILLRPHQAYVATFFELTRATPFIRDLMAIVVFNDYEKNLKSSSARSQISNSRLRPHYMDTVILTNNNT